MIGKSPEVFSTHTAVWRLQKLEQVAKSLKLWVEQEKLDPTIPMMPLGGMFPDPPCLLTTNNNNLIQAPHPIFFSFSLTWQSDRSDHAAVLTGRPPHDS